ncbi:hypothetical protein AJ80_00220 [Polytolypa hystricis UAMH7299]|uniref:N-acetyltransferase domain-containing protein n=1 Tax=Polytolypa hystricis (strain UAMH7299) TaxID=1447883 RepID=A0A2B7Z204_POLH7|nr:hypothetical protein AJ80_00220 [Polytolypa hystricis UAMH7299]
MRHQPADTASNGIPPSASESTELVSIPPSQQSRISERIVIARGDGVGMGSELRPQHAHETNEDEEDGFVAVDHEDAADYGWYFRRPQPTKPSALDALHPFVQLLSLSNIEDCVGVEAAFPEQERCSREKLMYRLTKCPELSLGIFSLPVAPNQPKPQPTLVAHIIATRTSSPQVTDATMAMPEDWQSKSSSTVQTPTDTEPLGHQDQGATIAIHSLAVRPEHQGKGLGTTVMKAYIQRIKDAAIADRIALLAHDPLIPFYESLGFENMGPSNCQFGGGGWNSMVLEFSNVADD